MASKTIFDTIESASASPFEDRFGGEGWPDRFGDWLRGWSEDQISSPIRTLSLFSGAGGLDIGFHQAGFKALEMVEFDDRFVPTLEANCGPDKLFGDAHPRCLDIREYTPKGLDDIDFIIGGPPCQTFSAAGRRAGGVQGTSDGRGLLFMSYVDLLCELEPKGFLFENVYGITGANNGRDWEAIQAAFSGAGYKIFHRVLDAADYGVPQHRERMFIIGLKSGSFNFPRPTHGPDSPRQIPHFSAGEAVATLGCEDSDGPSAVNGRYGHLLNEVPPGLNYSYFTERLGHPNPVFAWRSKFSDFLYKADPERPVRTLKAQGGQYTGPFHWENRPFTTKELKRLQTFPDEYTIYGGRAATIQQIGNSVPPQIARILAVSILDQVFGIEPPFELPVLASDEKLGFRKRKRELTAYYSRLAKSGIEGKKRQVLVDVKCRTWSAGLEDNFRVTQLSKADGGTKVVFRPGKKQWQFMIGSDSLSTSGQSFAIKIRPRAGMEWSLPCTEIRLTSGEMNQNSFTLAWKALEIELLRLGQKADLVQLGGYYQYQSEIQCEMTLRNNTDWRWEAVSAVVSGYGVARTLSSESFAQQCGIHLDSVVDFARFLRSLGFEIRNHYTNPQIPLDHWLLPYSFPTLNHQSVQLRKEIRS